MKKTLQLLQSPAAASISRLWGDGTIAFDTSALLDLYGLSATARTQVFDILRALDNIWLPHQVVLEYYRNRRKVAAAEEKEYEQALGALRKIVGTLDIIDRHASPADQSEHATKRACFLEAIEAYQEFAKAKGPRFSDEAADPIFEVLRSLFEGKVGTACGAAEMKARRAEAEARYQQKVPPGFNDSVGHGDALIWFELLARAEATKKGVILVLNDGHSQKKTDWWQKDETGKRLGPRIELLSEMRQRTGQDLVLYDLKEFIHAASQLLKNKKADKAVAEIDATEKAKLERERRLLELYTSFLAPPPETLERLKLFTTNFEARTRWGDVASSLLNSSDYFQSLVNSEVIRLLTNTRATPGTGDSGKQAEAKGEERREQSGPPTPEVSDPEQDRQEDREKNSQKDSEKE